MVKFFKKTAVICLAVSLLSFLGVPVQAQLLPMDRLSDAEQFLFNEDSNSAIITRIERIEEILYGKKQQGSLPARAEKIINDIFILEEDDFASIYFLINSLEWFWKDLLPASNSYSVKNNDILMRLERLETKLLGQKNDGPVVKRLETLVKETFPEENLPARAVIPADTLLMVKLKEEINSSEANIGDEIGFILEQDVIIDNILVIPADTSGIMEITRVSESGNFGKSGEVGLKFKKLLAIDGSLVNIALEDKAKEENSREMAIGASFLGTALFGPVGLVAGYFVKGNEEVIPKGSSLYIQNTSDTMLYGLKLD